MGGVPRITSFCWCLGLEAGAITVGVMHLCVALVLMILCSVFAENVRANIGTVEDVDGLYTTWYKIGVSVTVVSLVHVLLASALIYGARKRNIWCLRVWMCVMTILYFAAMCYCITYGMVGSGLEIFLSGLEALVFFGAVAYCIISVYNYYLMVKSSEDMQGPSATEY